MKLRGIPGNCVELAGRRGASVGIRDSGSGRRRALDSLQIIQISYSVSYVLDQALFDPDFAGLLLTGGLLGPGR